MRKVTQRVDITFIILVALVLIAVGGAFWQGGWELIGLGLVQAGHLIETVWFRLLLGFTLGGLVQVLIPRVVIARWLGPTSGIKGILIGSYASTIVSGAPYTTLPVVASLYAAGAGAGPIIALLTGQGLLSLQILIAWQIPFLGIAIPLSKFIVGLFITPLVGFTGGMVFKLLGGLPGTGARNVSHVSNTGQADGDGKFSRAVDKPGKM